VAGANTDYKRLLIKGIAYDAEEETITLQAALKAAVRGKYDDTGGGYSIIGSAGNGQSVTFQLPQSKFQPHEIAIAVSQLDDLYTDAVTELATDDIASPNDSQILARMLALLFPRNEASVDYSGMSRA
jgi:hypothetical protein